MFKFVLLLLALIAMVNAELLVKLAPGQHAANGMAQNGGTGFNGWFAQMSWLALGPIYGTLCMSTYWLVGVFMGKGTTAYRNCMVYWMANSFAGIL